MQQNPIEIKLTGLGNSPNDRLAEDGNLAFAMNVVHEEGSIKPANEKQPELIMDMGADGMVVYQHENDNYHHFIYKTPSGYHWRLKDGSGDSFSNVPLEADGEDEHRIVSLGHMLIFYTDRKTYYYKWDKNTYKYYGNELPDLKIKFGLKVNKYRASDNIPNFNPSSDLGDHSVTEYSKLPTITTSERLLERNDETNEPEFEGLGLKAEDEEHITTGVMAEVNKFTHEWCGEKGYFSQPFLVRAAYRLYDGNTTMHTAPVLMLPCTKCNPMVNIMMVRKFSIAIDVVGVGCELTYSLETSLDTLTQWSDIIKGVEIYVSPQFYTFDSSRTCKTASLPHFGINGMTNPFGCLSLNLKDNITTSRLETESYMKRNLYSILGTRIPDYSAPTYNGSGYFHTKEGSQPVARLMETGNNVKTLFNYYYDGGYDPISYIPLPKPKDEDINNAIKSCNTFYLVKSYSLDKLKINSFGEVIDLTYGKSVDVVTNQLMTDDYESHHNLSPKFATSYNNRVDLANVYKDFFDGFTLSRMSAMCFGDIRPEHSYYPRVFVFIKAGGEEFARMSFDVQPADPHCPTPYLYYPDPDAYKMVIISNDKKREFTLEEHKGLNGAVWFENLEDVYNEDEWTTMDNATKTYYENLENSLSSNRERQHLPHTVYTSEPANPWVIKAANVEDVGQGTIISMQPASLPMSSGQFGEYPMYCFSTDGTWALTTNDYGGWRAKQPIGYDTVLGNNPNNILRMQKDILMATPRGLMILSGNQTQVISEIFDGNDDIIISGKGWLTAYNTFPLEHMQNHILPLVWEGDFAYLQTENLYVPFKKFLENCAMAYDYKNQRILIGNPQYKFTYVFCLKDKLWTAIPVCLQRSVNSYPQCMAMIKDEDNHNKLVDFSSENPTFDLPSTGYILTRPFKVNDASIPKTIRTVNAQGQLDKGNVDLILYGSNDMAMKLWHIVGTAKGARMAFKYGSPYKAFRLGIITRLEKGECLDKVTVEFENKDTNKLRV